MDVTVSAKEGAFPFISHFEEGAGSNPEELIGAAAAHAGRFSMALAAGLTRAGYSLRNIHTSAKVQIDRVEDGFAITRMELSTEGDVPDIDEATFRSQAEDAKASCPVSGALAAVPEITLTARLLQTAQKQ